MTNMEKCVDFVHSIHPEIDNELDLQKYLDLMSDENRRIFEAKWGLDDSGTFCKSFTDLDKKLNTEKSRSLYHRALVEFDFLVFKISYASIIKNYEEDIELSFCYGIFLTLVCSDTVYPEKLKLDMDLAEVQKRVKRTLYYLTPLERQVLITKYGFKDSVWCKSDRKVASMLGLSVVNVIKTVNRIQKKFTEMNFYDVMLKD